MHENKALTNQSRDGYNFDGGKPKRKPSGCAVAFIALAALLYGVSPIDILPDAIPVLGWIDDLGLIVFAVIKFLQYKRNS